MNEEERVRKLALLPKWDELRSQYEVMVLQRKNDELKAEREDLWLQFPEESLLRMIGEIERKIKEFSGEYKRQAQNAEKKQNWGPYQ